MRWRVLNSSFSFNPKEACAQRQGPQQTFKEQAEEANHACNHTNHTSKFKYDSNVVNNGHEYENGMVKSVGRTRGQEKSEVNSQNEYQQEKVYEEKGNNNTNFEKESNS